MSDARPVGLDWEWAWSTLAIPIAALLAAIGTFLSLFATDIGGSGAAIIMPLLVFVAWCAAVGAAGGLAGVVGAASRAARPVSASLCALLAVPSFFLAWCAFGEWAGLWWILPFLLGLSCLAPLAVVLAPAAAALVPPP